MAFSNIDALQLGNLLQIVFSDGVRNQISEDYRDWEMVASKRVDDKAARELRFMLQSSLGPAAIQYRRPGESGRSFPRSQQVAIAEHIAKFKEINATVELEYNLWERAMKSPKYAEPLALEMQGKTIASKRRLAADYYADGTGVIGQLDTDGPRAAVESGKIRFNLENASNSARGFVGFFEYGDILVLREPDGTASAIDTDLVTEPVYWRVSDRDRENDQVVLEGLDASFNPVTITSITTQPGAGEVFFRFDQPTGGASALDLTSISDYGTASEALAGLESLVAADGRSIHGITMSGATKGTRVNAGNQPLDVTYIQKALDQVKVAVGQGRYSWKMMCMAPEAHAALIESRENDRRFQTVEDNKKGIKYFAYVHGNDIVETYTSEYCPKKRLYLMPEAKSGDKVMEYYGSDFSSVKAEGESGFRLKAHADGGYENTIVSYLQAICLLVCKHPASVGVVENFSL